MLSHPSCRLQVAVYGKYESESVQRLRDDLEDSSGQSFRPALGPSWFHCVGTRIAMAKRNKAQVRVV